MNTAAYCTRCSINWAVIASQDDEARDESYDFCPKCKSDMFLVEAMPGPMYIMNQLNGQIIDTKTREQLNKIKMPGAYQPEKVFDRAAWEQQQKEKEEKETQAIAAYQQAHSSLGHFGAQQIYFKTLNEQQ